MNSTQFEIQFDSHELPSLRQALGPEGVGAYIIKKALAAEKRQLIVPQMTSVVWRDNHSAYTNKRGMVIDQRHDVCAYMLRIGNQTIVPGFMRDLAESTTSFVRSLAPEFPILSSWGADEVSMHRYDDPRVGLSRHRDNIRFWGIIAVMTLEGSSDFVVYRDGREYSYRVEPGDLALMRATNLTGDPTDTAYQVQMNPEHGVVNVVGLPRISLIVRDNLRPAEPAFGFTYDNWDPNLEA